MDSIPFSVCVDCILFLANGDLPEDGADAAAVVAGVESEQAGGGTLVAGGGEEDDDEEGFSSSACECCGSRLGGDRYRATLLIPVAK